MVPRNKIKAYCDAIAREFKPEKIILFGSHAYGKPAPDSDVDLLVVMPRQRGVRTSLEIRRRVSAGFPLDILVRAPGETGRRLDWGDSFVREIINRGRVMYEARHT